jgi:hypothetical protein
MYTSTYAGYKRGGSPGGILVFDLDKDGKNLASEMEHLKSGVGTDTLLADSQSESEYFKSMRQEENLLYRADYLFSQDVFDERFRGFVDLAKLEEYLRPISPKPDMAELARNIIRYRFFAQQIVKQVFSMVERN